MPLHFELTKKRLVMVSKLVVVSARHWASDYYAANVEDLISEGWLIVIRLVKKYDIETPKDLYRMLVRACNNRFLDIANRRKVERKILSITDREELLSLVRGPSGLEDIYLVEIMDLLSERLTPRQCRVLQELVFPSAKAQKLAVKEAKAKGKLLGLPWIRGHKTVRIQRRHVVEALGVPPRTFRKDLLAIKQRCIESNLVVPKSHREVVNEEA